MVEDAYALASATARTAYDAMYLALAVRLRTRMITADERLVDALTTFPALAAHVQTVQDFDSGPGATPLALSPNPATR